MKWGRRKSHELSLHHIFFFSWVPKLKQMSTKKPKFRSATAMQKTRPKSPERPPPVFFRRSLHFQRGRGFHVSPVPDCYTTFQGLDIADPSISPQILSRRADRDLMGDPEDGPEFQFLNGRDSRWNDKLARKGLGSKLQESRKFSNMVSSIRKMKLQENEKPGYVEDQEPKGFKMPPPVIVRESKLTKASKRTTEEEKRSYYRGGLKWKQEILDPVSGNTVAVDSRRPHRSNKFSLDSRKPRQGVGDKPRRDGDPQRRKVRPKSRTGVPSPRSVSRSEMCKVKALQNLKKARKKREIEMGRAFDSFAVVKHSFNPHEDFRDSMIEMILENAIGQPEELENLLACYLSLNSYKYHDTIVKVFREVWFDLNRHWISQVEER